VELLSQCCCLIGWFWVEKSKGEKDQITKYKSQVQNTARVTRVGEGLPTRVTRAVFWVSNSRGILGLLDLYQS
jgi:hypothetical protein